MAAQYKVGGACESRCTKCKQVTAHVIVAMVKDLPKRVECETCHGQHNYRPAAAKKKATKAGATRKKPVKRTTKSRARSWTSVMAQRTPDDAGAYSMTERFEADQLISHPRFGLGVVRTAAGNKIEVLFEEGTKLLVHDR